MLLRSTTSHIATVYPYYSDSSDYTKLTSRVDYQVGYSCGGEAVVVRVSYRKLSFTDAYPDPVTHVINYDDLHYRYSYADSGHVTGANLFRPGTSCYGACTVSAESASIVLLDYWYTDNYAVSFVKWSNPLGTNFDVPWYHCFVRNTYSSSSCH